MTRKEIQKLDHQWFDEDLNYENKVRIISDFATAKNTCVNILENYSYPTGLIGWVYENKKVRAVYDPDKMIEDLMVEENWSYDEAADWFGENTMRATPYCYTKYSPCPIIIEYDEEDYL